MAKVLVSHLFPTGLNSGELSAIKRYAADNNLTHSNEHYTYYAGEKIHTVVRYNGNPYQPPRGTKLFNMGVVGVIGDRMLQWVVLDVDK